MEKSSEYPDWAAEVHSLEDWLSGYELGAFDPRSAIINLLSPSTPLNLDGEERSISRFSASVLPNGGKSLKLKLSFKCISDPQEVVEDCLANKSREIKMEKFGPHVLELALEEGAHTHYFECGKVKLELAYSFHNGFMKIVLANANKAAKKVNPDENYDEVFSDRVTGWRIQNWLMTAFCIEMSLYNDSGFKSIPDNAFKFSYLASHGSLCNTINTSYRKKSDTEIEITSMPIYEERRFETWGDDLDALKFDNLSLLNAKESISTNLRKVLERVRVETVRVKSKHEALAKDDPRFSDELQLTISSFDQELQLMEDGIDRLMQDEDAMWAFMFLNSAMARKRSNFRTWRPFQITFLLTCITKFFRNKNEPVVLNFPTGMGKTEAFLGYAIWIAAYQRKKAENFGTVAIIKYPRVMLSKQQAVRAMELISAANSCLMECDRSIRKTPLSVGVLFSKSDTPNRLVKSGNRGYELSDEFSDLIRISKSGGKAGFVISKCPCPDCKNEKIEFRPDPQKGRIIFRCGAENCVYSDPLWNGESIYEGEKGEIPIYISDEEVFRYSPTIILTTIYKFASLCSSARWKTLLASSKAVDSRYGSYYYEKDKEEVLKMCKERGLKPWFSATHVENAKFLPPSLLIFDENHLITGAQASLLGPVETAFLDIFHIQSGKFPQIVSSSATLSKSIVNASEREFQHQIAQLFGCGLKDSVLVPSSLDIYQSGESGIQRTIVGIYPGVNTKRYSIEKISTYILNRMRNEANEDYQIPLFYFGSKPEMGVVKNNMESRIAGKIGIPNISGMITEFSADVSNVWEGDISIQLEELNRGRGLRIALATNTIANGIDSDRFNCMIFHGLPNSVSEYVQARSRIARRKRNRGLVILSLSRYNPREKAFYEKFYSWHENQEYLYDTNPVNKFSDGIVAASIPRLLHLYAFWKWDNPYRKGYLNNEMWNFLNNYLDSQNPECINQLGDWLSVPRENPYLLSKIKGKIEAEMRDYLGYLQTRKNPPWIYDSPNVKPSQRNKHLPKPSTLEVSEEIPVRLGRHGIWTLTKIFGRS